MSKPNTKIGVIYGKFLWAKQNLKEVKRFQKTFSKKKNERKRKKKKKVCLRQYKERCSSILMLILKYDSG